MDNSETDRVFADEMRSVLKELRDKNKKLTDEKEAGKGNLAWIIVVALAVALIIALTAGADSHNHYHRY
jgi:CHASE3 domain sensor protein